MSSKAARVRKRHIRGQPDTMTGPETKRLDKAVGKLIQRRRLAASLTQEQVADALGINRVSLAGIEAGKRRPDTLLLAGIAKAVGCRLVDLVPADEEVWLPKVVNKAARMGQPLAEQLRGCIVGVGGDARYLTGMEADAIALLIEGEGSMKGGS